MSKHRLFAQHLTTGPILGALGRLETALDVCILLHIPYSKSTLRFIKEIAIIGLIPTLKDEV